MEFTVKRFDELTVDELFEIYSLRVSVFIVEQNCPYQDVDEYDRSALHLTLRDNGKILAYARVLPAGTVFDEVSLGRVIAVERRKGYGSRIVAEALRAARDRFGAGSVVIEAQTYAKKLYEKKGFVQVSDEFSEDGIPHIKMLKIF